MPSLEGLSQLFQQTSLITPREVTGVEYQVQQQSLPSGSLCSSKDKTAWHLHQNKVNKVV